MEHLKKLKQDYLEKDKAQSARLDEPHKLSKPIDKEPINYEKEGGIFVNSTRNSDGLLKDYLEVQTDQEDQDNASRHPNDPSKSQSKHHN